MSAAGAAGSATELSRFAVLGSGANVTCPQEATMVVWIVTKRLAWYARHTILLRCPGCGHNTMCPVFAGLAVQDEATAVVWCC